MGRVACIGSFETFHVGHKRILQKALDVNESSSKPIIVLIRTLKERSFWTCNEAKSIIARIGDFELIWLNLEEEKHKSPEEFIEFLTAKDISNIVVGNDFRFGKNRSGDVNLLETKFKVFSEEMQTLDGKKISSSWAIELLQGGMIPELTQLLGYGYKIRATVYKDKQLARTLNYPTVNLKLTTKILPKSGVYASKVRIKDDEKVYYGMTNIGERPTTNKDGEVVSETNIFDYSGDLYDQCIEVELIKFIRGQKKFNGLEELIQWIKNDEAVIRDILGEYNEKNG